MHNLTRALFSQYLRDTAENNGLSDDFVSGLGITQFNVEPTIQQALIDIVREEVGFLERISMPVVVEQMGEKIGLDINSTIASNTDTLQSDREVFDPTTLVDVDKYFCQQTNFDLALRYAKLDQWRKFPDFAERLSRAIARQKGRDQIMIGWHGEERAANSNRTANPTLKDVAEGWLHKIERIANERVLSQGDNGAIKIGLKGDFKNIDALAFDLMGEKMGEHHDDAGKVAIVGRELLHDKYLQLLNESNAATERNANDIIMTNRTVGGLPAVIVPFFPKRDLLITDLSNLAIYHQEGGDRRTLTDNAKRDQYEDRQSSNIDYMVEDYTAIAYAKNIEVRTNDNSETTATWG